MKRLIWILGAIGAGLCSHAAHATPSECFTSSAAVFAAHPNATHASYSLRVKRSGRCWYADAFRTDAKARTKPAPRHVAQTPAPPPATTMPRQHQRTTTDAPWPRGMALVLPPHTTGAAPPPMRVGAQFPRDIPPAVQLALTAQELSRIMPVDETPADFESRFSASGYRVRR